MNDTKQAATTESLINILGEATLEQAVKESWNLQREVEKRYDLPRWEHMIEELRSYHLSISARLRVPLPAPVGAVLSEESAAVLRNKAVSLALANEADDNDWLCIINYLLDEIPKLVAPSIPSYYVTAERKPTEKDGNDCGQVLASMTIGWSPCHWEHASKYGDYWMPMPPTPVKTAEEEAFDRIWPEFSMLLGSNKVDAFALWKARGEFEAKKEGK